MKICIILEQTTRAFQQNFSLTKSDLLCLVTTQPSNHGNRAKQVKVTWGHRCGTLRFATSKADKDFPELIDLNVNGESSQLQKKLEKGLQYIHKYHL